MNQFASVIRWPLLLATVVAWNSLSASADEVTRKFVSQGVTKQLGGYRPIRAAMDQEADIVIVPPAELTAPKFGWIEVGEYKWAFVLDEPAEQLARLFIDSNRDGDLTNDPATTWNPREQGELTMYDGTCQIELADGELGSLGLYRFDPNDERRAQLKDTLLFYLDFGYEYSFDLDGQNFVTLVAGEIAPDQSLGIDRDGNGKLSSHYERTKVDQPFNFTGTTYVFTLRDGRLHLDPASESLEQLPLPPNLAIGQTALPFTTQALDGTEVNFPADYAGKLVMLDFWATWCGPCIGEIPNMKAAYEQWHDDGFEILGISFDREDMDEKVAEFLTEREISWPQIYEGKFWETTLGIQHDVSAIPFVLLVDGDSGKILATSRELRGEGLADFIGEQLKQKQSADSATAANASSSSR